MRKLRIEDYTFESWINGLFECDENYTYSIVEKHDTSEINDGEYEQILSELVKIRKAQIETLDWALSNNLNYLQMRFKIKSIHGAKEKVNFVVKTEQKLIKKRIRKKFHLLSGFIKKPELINAESYKLYLEESTANNHFYFPLDKENETYLEFEYLNWLKTSNFIYYEILSDSDISTTRPEEYTLFNFFQGDEGEYYKLLDRLTLEIFGGDKEYPPIVIKENGKYVFINKKPNQRFLGAFILTLIKKKWLYLDNKIIRNRDILKSIILKTFNIDKFDKNNASKILHKDILYFDNYFYPYRDISKRI